MHCFQDNVQLKVFLNVHLHLGRPVHLRNLGHQVRWDIPSLVITWAAQQEVAEGGGGGNGALIARFARAPLAGRWTRAVPALPLPLWNNQSCKNISEIVMFASSQKRILYHWKRDYQNHQLEAVIFLQSGLKRLKFLRLEHRWWTGLWWWYIQLYIIQRKWMETTFCPCPITRSQGHLMKLLSSKLRGNKGKYFFI